MGTDAFQSRRRRGQDVSSPATQARGRAPCQPAAPARLLHDRTAATAIEMGLIAFPYIFCIVFLFQIAMTFFWSNMLDYATQTAARQIQVGSAQDAGSIHDAIAGALYMLSMNNIIVDLQAVPLDGQGNPDFLSAASAYTPPASSRYCTPQSEQGLLLRATFQEPVFGGTLLREILPLRTVNGSWVYPITATAPLVVEKLQNPPGGGSPC